MIIFISNHAGFSLKDVLNLALGTIQVCLLVLDWLGCHFSIHGRNFLMPRHCPSIKGKQKTWEATTKDGICLLLSKKTFQQIIKQEKAL